MCTKHGMGREREGEEVEENLSSGCRVVAFRDLVVEGQTRLLRAVGLILYFPGKSNTEG